MEIEKFNLKQTHELGAGYVAQVLRPNGPGLGDSPYSTEDHVLVFSAFGQDILMHPGEHKTLHDLLHHFIVSPQVSVYFQGNERDKNYFAVDFVKIEQETRRTVSPTSTYTDTQETWELHMGTSHGQGIVLRRPEMGKLYNMLRHIHMTPAVIAGQKAY